MIVARNAQIALPPPYSTLQMTDSSLNDIGAQSPRTLFTEIEDALRKQNNDDHGAPCTNQGLISNKLALGTNNMSNARDQIFQLASMVGNLCTLFLSVPHDPIQSATERPSPDDDPFWLESSPSPEKDRVANQLGQVFVHMFATAGTCGVDLCTSILKKVELNGRKYPVELCKGKSGKYTNYSEHTGITPTKGQSTVDSPTKTSSTPMEDTASVEGLSLLIRNFANERHWNRYHTPRNIALALLGEVGELAELFQWKGDEGELELSDEERDKIGQEVADVTIYLLRLADVCHVQLGEVTMQLLTEARV